MRAVNSPPRFQLSDPQAARQRLRFSSQETRQKFLLQVSWHWLYLFWQSISHCEAAKLLPAVRAVTAKPSAKLSIVIFFFTWFFMSLPPLRSSEGAGFHKGTTKLSGENSRQVSGFIMLNYLAAN